MPRGRMLNKRISTDDKVAKLSLKATLFYTWCIPYLDFEGRIFADVWSLKSIFPFVKEIVLNNIPELINELVCADLVVYYGNGLHKYMQFKGFKKNQSLREDREAGSEIPAPTTEQLQSNSVETPDEVRVKLSKDKRREGANAPTTQEFFDYLKSSPSYKGIDIETERGRAEAWIVTHPPRKFTKKFFLAWLNRIDRPLEMKKPIRSRTDL